MDADFLLIRKMKQGDERAIEMFVRKYYPVILQYCGYRCFDSDYAQDLAQETFARFFAALPQYRHQGKVKNYLYTIAGNLCRDQGRKKAEIPVEELIELPDDRTGQMDEKIQVEWALRQLPEEFREIIILYYFQELKGKEIAALLRIGLPLVKYRLRRAKELLEKLLGEEEEA